MTDESALQGRAFMAALFPWTPSRTALRLGPPKASGTGRSTCDRPSRLYGPGWSPKRTPARAMASTIEGLPLNNLGLSARSASYVNTDVQAAPEFTSGEGPHPHAGPGA